MLAYKSFMISPLRKIICAANPASRTLYTFQTSYFKRTFCVQKMSGAKDRSIPNNKKKPDISVWKPKSTQSGTSLAGIVPPPSSSSADNNKQAKHTSENTSVSGDCSQKCSISLEVGASIIRFIKGKGGSTQKQIEEETGTKIIFSSLWNGDHIVIEGNSNESVTKASEKIATVLEQVVKSPSLDYSHFVSLPLAIHTELVDKLQNFQNSILECSNTTELGIEKSIFINPKTFHLTVLMLKLWNKDRVAAATEVLQKISTQVHDALDNRPVFIRLQGLECMRGSPANARVVYAPVEEIGGEGRLLNVCQVIIKAYVDAGLVLEKDARQSLKLHATIMNARHRKRNSSCKRRDTFDARNVFLKHGSVKWGDYIIREAHLSQRFKFDEAGYYRCCASLPFPESVQAE